MLALLMQCFKVTEFTANSNCQLPLSSLLIPTAIEFNANSSNVLKSYKDVLTPDPSPSIWEAPCSDFLKVNCDGAFDGLFLLDPRSLL